MSLSLGHRADKGQPGSEKPAYKPGSSLLHPALKKMLSNCLVGKEKLSAWKQRCDSFPKDSELTRAKR